MKRLEIELHKFNILKNQIIKKIDTIEEEMANYIFDDELKMETAYQDNRYTYENMANNNYDNMLIFLNVLKSVVTQDKIQRIDYDQLYRNLTVSQKNSSKSSVVKTTEYEIRDFEQLFSRKDKRYSCAKRISKKGAISKFFKSKKDIKLDAIYSAELKYFGALSVKDNDNLFISECAIASELYLKSLLRSKETIHSLKDLYIKVDNKVKSMIVRKVNSYLKLDLTKKEFLAILSKNEISNAFSEYRYLYEKEADKEDVKFVEALTRALHSVSASKIKYKSPYYEAIEKEIREDSQKQK